MRKFFIGMFALLAICVLTALGVIPTISATNPVPSKVAVAMAVSAKTTLERGDIVVLNGKPALVTGTFGKISHAVVLVEGGTTQLFPESFGPEVVVVKKTDRARQADIVLDAIRRQYRIE